MSSAASRPPSLILYSSGSNAQNQLSHSQREDSHVFLPCVASASSSSTSELNSSFPPPRTRSILQLAFGANHTTCLLETENGRRQVWACGDGEGGQLGLTENGEREARGREGEGGGARGGGFRKLKLPSFPLEVLVELERTAEGGTYCYQPIKIAASWTTTFIAFSATLLSPSSTSSPPPRSRRPSPDLLLAMGTNDFAELGNGRRGRASEEERFCWHVFQDEKILDLVSGPRHVLLHLANESSRRLVGWGAARHGQLSTPLSTLPSSKDELETPPPPAPSAAAVLLVPIPLPSASSSQSLLSPLTQLALGLHHTFILHPHQPHSSQLQIHGRPSNPATQISLPPSLDASTILQIASTWSSSVLLLSHQPTSTSPPIQSILSFSKTPSKPLALPPNATSPTLRAGSEHVLVLLSLATEEEKEGVEGRERKEVWGWGWNEHGNMGDGGVEDWVGLGRVWPSSSTNSSSKDIGGDKTIDRERVVDCWAGNGTSWVLVERA